VATVARRHDVNPNQVFAWRQLYRRGRLGPKSREVDAQLLPVSVGTPTVLPTERARRNTVTGSERSEAARPLMEIRLSNGHRVALASPIALEALERIGRLYQIEAEIRSRPPDERCAVRQARAGPHLQSLHEWLHKTLTMLSRKSELAKAIRYALSNWVALTRYRDDGRLEADNNAAERALRALATERSLYTS
jgi:transposase-like protein